MSEMSAESGDALDVLRAIWRSQGQTATDLDDEAGENKSCKRMADAGRPDRRMAGETAAGRQAEPGRRQHS